MLLYDTALTLEIFVASRFDLMTIAAHKFAERSFGLQFGQRTTFDHSTYLLFPTVFACAIYMVKLKHLNVIVMYE